MTQREPFAISVQPDDVSCGPASLHAVYNHLGLDVTLAQVARSVRRLPHRGTLAVYLGLDALWRGLAATIYTCNLHLFDPTWFQDDAPELAEKLAAQMQAKPARDRRLQQTSRAYLEYLAAGGKVRMQDITPDLLVRLIGQGPVVAGLSETWLYRCRRESPATGQPDDVAGKPGGHFVVFHACEPGGQAIHIADPWRQLPYPGSHHYVMPIWRVIGAVMLGIVTYDAKLLVIQPPDAGSCKENEDGEPACRQ